MLDQLIRPSHLLAPAALVAVLCGSALAQNGPSAADLYNNSYLSWIPSATPDFSSVQSGNLIGNDGYADLAVLESGKLWVLDGPGERHLLTQVSDGSTPVTAFTIQPANTPGQPDRLITSNSYGLWAYSWDATVSDIVLEGSLSSLPGAIDADSLEVQVLPTGTHMLCGLSGSRQEFFGGVLNPLSYTELSRFNPGLVPQAWCSLQWDGIARPEFAVQSSAGLMVFDHTGGNVLPVTIPLNSPTPLLAAYHDPVLGSDRLLWSTVSQSNTHYEVYQLDQRFNTVEPALNLGSFLPGAFAVGSWDASGNRDLFVSESGTGTVRIFPQDTSAVFPIDASHDDANYEELIPFVNSSSTNAFLNVADFDADGDDDLALSHSSQGTAVIRGQLIDGMLTMPQRPDVTGDITLSYPGGGLNAQLDMLLVGSSSTTANECLVELFVQSDPYGLLTQTTPVATDVLPLDGSVPSFTWPVSAPYTYEMLQVRITPMLNGVQLGTPRIVYYYTGDPNGVLPQGLVAPPGFPPKPKVGPGCTSNC